VTAAMRSHVTTFTFVQSTYLDYLIPPRDVRKSKPSQLQCK